MAADMNAMNDPSKDTDCPTGTFDQPVTEKRKRFVSDSGKQKRKRLLLIKGNDSGRTEESVEKEINEYLLKCAVEYQERFTKIPDLDKGGLHLTHKEGLEPTHEVEEVVYEILSDDDTSAADSETEDGKSLHEFNKEMYLEDSIEGGCYDIEYNEEESNAADLGDFKYNVDPMTSNGDY